MQPNIVDGQTLGPFTVVTHLGRGGMGAVYRAYEPGLDREVALKVLPHELLGEPGFAERFKREARVIASLEHPNIVPVYGSGIDSGVPWMALRLVRGGHLGERLSGLSQDQALRCFAMVADALDYAHSKGVIHRDLKPQNVLFGGVSEIYLADFGIAKLLAGRTALTEAGAILGSPQYMAPEQAKGEDVCAATDQYALAIMLYEWLTGSLPFVADSPYAVMYKHVTEPLPLQPLLGKQSERVRNVIARALAKEPSARWPSASRLVEELRGGLKRGDEPAAPNETATQPTHPLNSLPVDASATAAPSPPPLPMPNSKSERVVVAPPPAKPRRAGYTWAAFFVVAVLGAVALEWKFDSLDESSTDAQQHADAVKVAPETTSPTTTPPAVESTSAPPPPPPFIDCTPPEIQPHATYPPAAIRRRLEGSALLRIEVLADKRIGRVEIQESSGHSILDDAAVDAARKATVLRAEQCGENTRTTSVLLPLSFSLYDESDGTADPGWAVQVGAFQDESEATGLSQRIGNLLRLRVYQEAVPTESGTFYRVRVGNFPSREAALVAQATIREQAAIDGVVVPP